MLDTRRSTWTTLRRHLGRRRPHRAVHPDLATVVPLRTVLATLDTDSAVPQAPRRPVPLSALNPSDALSRMLPH